MKKPKGCMKLNAWLGTKVRMGKMIMEAIEGKSLLIMIVIQQCMEAPLCNHKINYFVSMSFNSW